MVPSVVTLKPTISSRPSNPLNAFLLASRIWLSLTILRAYKLYVFAGTYLLTYLLNV